MSTYQEIVGLENEALTAQAKHDYRQAILANGQALRLAQGLNRPRLTAVLFNRLGQALEADGQIQEAVIAYETGLKALAAEKRLDIDEVLVSLGAVSKGFSGSRDLAASDLYEATTAQDLGEAESDPALPVKLLINVGNAYLRQPQEEPALNAYQEALRRPEIAHAPELRGHALTHVAIIRRRRGETEAAAGMLSEALGLLGAYATPVEKRRALAALAGIYRDQGGLEQALETYQGALALYAQVDDPRGEGITRAGLGRLLLEAERYDQARQAFQEAVALAEGVDDEDTLWYAYWGLGRCQQVAGDLDEAATSFRRSLDLVAGRQRELRTDEGKVTFLESTLDIFDQLIAVHLERAQPDASLYQEALAVAEEARGRALRDLMGGRRRRRPSSAVDIRPSRMRPFPERISDLIAPIAPGIMLSPGDFDSAAQMAPDMPSPPTDISSLVSQMAPGIESGPLVPPAEEELAAIQESPETASPPPLARLVFHILSDRTAVFAVTPGGEVLAHVADLGRDALAERVGQVRRALEVDDAPRGVRALFWVEEPEGPEESLAHESLLRDLYTELIAPVAEALPTDGTPVFIEPHGALWLLPFAALLDPDGAWLADRWPLLYAPSAQTLDEIRGEPDYGGPTDLKALIVGNPTMPEVRHKGGLEVELDPLPGAEQEARTIAGLFPEGRCTLLLGAEADRARVETQAAEHGILHLATHGIAYAEDPLASFVALAEPEDGDGLLTAREVMSISLPADLVTLSACQTGLGKVAGEGMIGLSRAFLVAGARAVLVSQWSVSDEATAALMSAFYRGYLELDDKALALQRAMQELRSEPAYVHPRYWAPFVVVGAEA